MKKVLFLYLAAIFMVGSAWAQQSDDARGDRDRLLRSLGKSSVGFNAVLNKKQKTTSPTAVCYNDVYVNDATGNDANAGDTPATAKLTIQAGIDAVCDGGTVHVYPGSYSETAAGRFVLGVNGPHQFGLFVDKNNITIQGVDGSGTPITDYNSVLAEVATNATNNFGYSGIFVQGDGVTIQGLKILGNTAGDNKTFEIIGDAFALKYCDITTGYSIYFDDWQFDTGTNTSHVQSYTIEKNVLRLGGSIDLASGAGFSGPVSGRVIKDNKFEADPSGQYWPFISFNGSGTGVPWFVYSVGGAVITGNDFSNTYNTVDLTSAHIRARGTYDNSQFDWTSYWNYNTFNKAVVTLVGAYPPFDVRTYSYTTSYSFPNVRRLGLTIQGEVNNAVAGDNVLVAPGTYPESPVIAKSLTLVSSGGREVTTIALQTGTTYLSGLTIKGDGTEITVDGFTIKGFDAVGAGLASSNIVVENGASNTPASVVIKNNRVQVGNIGAGANGDDGMGLITYYNTSLFVGSLTVEGNIFEPLNSEAFRAFYINPGVNTFVFRGNEVTGQFNGTALTQAKDGLVEENTVTGTGVAGSRSAGLGTWGYPTPSDGYGATTFRNNVISNCRGISIYETVNVIVENNFLTNCDRGVRVLTAIPLAFDVTTIHIRLNSITGSHFNGVEKDAAVAGVLDAEKNWWDSSTGPTHASNPGGTGNTVSNDVEYNPWLCDGTDTDVAIGFQPNVTLLCGSEAPPKPFVFLANECVTITRAKQSTSMGDIHSNNLIYFLRGDPNKFTGDLTAVGNIKIDKEIKIIGDATAGGKITLGEHSSITGTKTPYAPVAPIPIIAPPGCSPSGTNRTVKKDGSLTLPPGSYGKVIVGDYAKLKLSAGNYCFDVLETKTESVLQINVAGGPVTITVMTSLKLGKELEMQVSSGEAGSSAITFNALQSTKVLIDKGGYVLGSFIAPNAEVVLAKNVSFRGSICANKITVDRDVVFLHHTSPGSLPKPVLEDNEEISNAQAPVTSYELGQNYPNPFNPSTTISFALPQAGEVNLTIYNIYGQLVRQLVAGQMTTGRHSVIWNGKNERGQQVASGMYLYVLKAGEFTAHRKLVLMK